MELIFNPLPREWGKLCERNIPDDSDIENSVKEIISAVKEKGDSALFDFARRFDGFEGESLLVSDSEI